MHYKTGGFYSSEIIAHALSMTTMSRHSKILYTLSLKPLHAEPERIHAVIGAIVNLANRREHGLLGVEAACFFVHREMPCSPQALDCVAEHRWSDLAA